VDVRGLGPTQIGRTATLIAGLLELKDNKLRCAGSAVNDQGKQIGEGPPPRRAAIDTQRFGGGEST
jgi:predicted thioesterase